MLECLGVFIGVSEASSPVNNTVKDAHQSTSELMNKHVVQTKHAFVLPLSPLVWFHCWRHWVNKCGNRWMNRQESFIFFMYISDSAEAHFLFHMFLLKRTALQSPCKITVGCFIAQNHEFLVSSSCAHFRGFYFLWPHHCLRITTIKLYLHNPVHSFQVTLHTLET